MKKIIFYLSLVVIVAESTSCNNSKTTKNASSDASDTSNVFAKPSKLALEAPDFDKIKDSDFAPAFDAAMKQQQQEVDAVKNNPAAPTFENTILGIEKSGQYLGRVNSVFGLLTGANTNPTLQKLQENIAPKQSANSDAIYLDSKLFARVKAVYDGKSSSKLDAESLRLIDIYYQRFTLAGASLSDGDKAKLKTLNKEDATLSTQFSNKLLAAGKGLDNTTQQSALQDMSNRGEREKLFNKAWNRAEMNDANDTRKTISRLAQIRGEQAKLLGFANYAAWKLQDQMAKTPEAVNAFLKDLVPAATAKAKAEEKDIQSLIDTQKGGFKVQPWDWNFYAEQVRKAKYNIDEKEIKPYFELNTVLEKGVFYAANQLYGITFKERKDLPVYQKDVRVFDVFDKDGSQLGLFYGDYFKRDNKSGGAWMGNLVPQSKLFGHKPVIYNVCNFAKPTNGEPALLSFDDVITMFHEFGHALHGLFGNQQYESVSGTNVARDYVEFPSQFNEHWASDPKVLKNYAIQYKTEKAMPQDLLDRIKKASTFNEGYAFTEALAASTLDMQWYTLPAGSPLQNVNEFEKNALAKTNLNLNAVPPRYRSSYFLHIWSNGYGAGYYAYTWTSMLENDAFSWFQEHGGLTRENGQRFRDMILSKGNTEDYNKMFFDFRGHKPDIKPMLRKRGLL
ncbi:peptidyl-dipeptidase Dcp [Pedobacter sp. UYEF25]